MTISKTHSFVLFSTATAVTIASSISTISDSFDVDTSADSITIQVKASTPGTPDSTDQVEFYLVRTVGNVGEGTDVFESSAQGLYVATADMNDENPSVVLVDGIGANFKSGKVYALGRGTANSYEISASLYTRKVT